MKSLYATLAATSLLLSCNDYPVHRLLDNFEVRVTKNLSHSDPVKLDFLWVIDHSPSMCQEQRDLAKGFSDFTKSLQKLGSIDAQMAVVSVQQLPDIAKAEVYIEKVGKFMHSAATTFPPNCIERVRLPCSAHTQCTKDFSFTFNPADPNSSLCAAAAVKPFYANEKFIPGDSDWQCKAPSEAKQIGNDNCSINSYCWKRCKNDAECHAIYGNKSTCYSPGGDPSFSSAGCLFLPDTKDCPPPDKLPAVLKQTQLGLFHCIATLGASQSTESKFEGGFRSAWMALDPNGPNCPGGTKLPNGKPNPACQYANLIRDDAHLVIVFVSDDDDCSVNLKMPLLYSTPAEREATKGQITAEEWEKCQTFGDAIAGNPSLNDGYCEYRKSKNPAIRCPSDCRKENPAGGPPLATCMQTLDLGLPQPVPSIMHKFAPVSEFVNKFRSLKADPARVIVATITGDSIVKDAQKQADDRVSYYRSLLLDIAVSQAPYICAGARGEAGFGSRYVQLALAFQENGILANICEGSDFGPALTNIADTILKRVVKVCLPHPPGWDTKANAPVMKVVRKRGSELPKALKFTTNRLDPNPDTYYLKASADCLAGKGEIQGGSLACKKTSDCAAGLACDENLCKVYNQAIYFTAVPKPGDGIEVNYAADLGL